MRVGAVRRGLEVRSIVLLLFCSLIALGGLATPGQAAAYQGEQQMWRMMNIRENAVIVVVRLDTGDVNANTYFVNQIDAQFVRDSLGSSYKQIKFAGYEDSVPGTTVMRRFTFTLNGKEGFLICTDEWGPNMFMFMFAGDSARDREVRTFISDTVIAREPTSIPSGFGPAEEVAV